MNNLGGRRRSIEAERKTLLLQPKIEPVKPEPVVISEPVRGPKMCPKCGKAKAYFFHVKHCKG